MITLWDKNGNLSTLPDWVDVKYYLAKGFTDQPPPEPVPDANEPAPIGSGTRSRRKSKEDS